MTTSLSILLRTWKNMQTKAVEGIETHISFEKKTPVQIRQEWSVSIDVPRLQNEIQRTNRKAVQS